MENHNPTFRAGSLQPDPTGCTVTMNGEIVGKYQPGAEISRAVTK